MYTVSYIVITIMAAICLYGFYGIARRYKEGKKPELRRLIVAEISILMFCLGLFLKMRAHFQINSLMNTAGRFVMGIAPVIFWIFSMLEMRHVDD